ncbi:hypothetical protein G7Y89_g1458 [Cudoniella acicularis]|uniref:2EXR domain-containing protein n=1 Tax=Cudoniella acicularis TaxID=354080 RepID=A0A8H4W7E2_9HELO|nr:hypothetical protein G7Y89_g1458 [Cudoniella acicularis]
MPNENKEPQFGQVVDGGDTRHNVTHRSKISTRHPEPPTPPSTPSPRGSPLFHIILISLALNANGRSKFQPIERGTFDNTYPFKTGLGHNEHGKSKSTIAPQASRNFFDGMAQTSLDTPQGEMLIEWADSRRQALDKKSHEQENGTSYRPLDTGREPGAHLTMDEAECDAGDFDDESDIFSMVSEAESGGNNFDDETDISSVSQEQDRGDDLSEDKSNNSLNLVDRGLREKSQSVGTLMNCGTPGPGNNLKKQNFNHKRELQIAKARDFRENTLSGEDSWSLLGIKQPEKEGRVNIQAPSEGIITIPILESSAKFRKFTELAPEIRCLILKYIWEPRKVEIYPRAHKVPNDNRADLSSDTYHSGAQPPVTLWINRESRHETLRYYKLSFAAPKKEALVYFNPQIDTVYIRSADILRSTDFSNIFPKEDLRNIRHLDITWLHINSLMFTWNSTKTTFGIDCSFKNFLHQFPGLGTLNVILNDDRGEQERPQKSSVCAWSVYRTYNQIPPDFKTFEFFRNAMFAQAKAMNKTTLPTITLKGAPNVHPRGVKEGDYEARLVKHCKSCHRRDPVQIWEKLREVDSNSQSGCSTAARNLPCKCELIYGKRYPYNLEVQEEDRAANLKKLSRRWLPNSSYK